MRRALLTIFLFPLPLSAELLPDVPFSDDARGTTGASFLRTGSGARARALADAFVAVPGDPDAVFWNPAGLAEVGRRQLTASYDSLVETSYSSSFSVSAPRGRSVWAFWGQFNSQTPIDAYDALGDPQGDFQPYDLALAATVARPIGMSSAGFTFKAFRQRLADRTALGWAVDGGWQWRNVGFIGTGPVDMGMAFRNFGPPVKLGHRSDPLPLDLAMGLHWRAGPRVSMTADAHLPVDRSPYLSAGLETRIPAGNASLALRAGYSLAQASDVDGLSGVTAGIGVVTNGLRFDLAWVPMGDLGHTHRATVGIRF